MTRQRQLRVAVLGSGIMGAATALFLARGGCSVTIFEREASVMSGASRWNEGKVHLGFLYSADPSLRTAAKVLAGGLSFKPLLEELIGCSIAPATTPEDDLYLVHPDSIVAAPAMKQYVEAVHDLLLRHNHASYLAPIRAVEELTPAKLEQLSGVSLLAGFRVPERSVDTLWIADRLVEALEAEPRVAIRTGTAVAGVEPTAGSWRGPWKIRCGHVLEEPYDFVVNALWAGRLLVDRSLGLSPRPGWSHRFRLSLFIKTARQIELPSMVLAAGPFGDIKNYDGYRFYLSWYPAGLIAQGEEVAPPEHEIPPASAVIDPVRQALTAALPPVRAVFDHAQTIRVGGGWVFASGKGSLADWRASLHRRDCFGITRSGTYFSVDTGKYSTAPWLARDIADQIMGNRM